MSDKSFQYTVCSQIEIYKNKDILYQGKDLNKVPCNKNPQNLMEVMIHGKKNKILFANMIQSAIKCIN